MTNDIKHKIESLQGPILVLGASGFIGANLLRSILRYREDIDGLVRSEVSWRLNDVSSRNIFNGDINYTNNRTWIAKIIEPRTVFDCLAYGSYPFQTDIEKIKTTNVWNKTLFVSELIQNGMDCYIHAGSSSEYGNNSSAPLESSKCLPNSEYAKSKYQWSKSMSHPMGTNPKRANLRLYSVYGPYEDGSRLIPQVIQHGIRGEYPPFVRPDISRDFIYVDDVVEAFVDAALNLKPEDYGGSFNIGTGVKTTIAQVAEQAQRTFRIDSDPTFSMPPRDWDHCNDWYANPTKARERLGWSYKTSLEEGIAKTVEWFKSQGEGWEWPTLAPRVGCPKRKDVQ